MEVSMQDDDSISILEEQEVEDFEIKENEINEEGVEEDDHCNEPVIGMKFDSDVEAQKFYKSYGSRLGFSVRINTFSKSKVGISSIRMVCSKHGFCKRQQQETLGAESGVILSTPTKEVPIKRGGCGAYIRFRRMSNGTWTVSAFNSEHNHELISSPSKKRNLRSLKGMTYEEKKLIRDMRAQNIPTTQIYHFMADKAGGSNELTFNKKDVSNLIAEDNRHLVGVDIESTLMYFRQKQEMDPEFFFAIDPDENGVAKNIFWVEGRARREFLEFGDVVTFDTTYNTNKYYMPLGLFIGVSHHWHSLIFGCCLLRNEKSPNFVWLFKTWMQAMYNKAPNAIITDQCPSMKASIEVVFSNTVHRCCQWHVMRNAREHLFVHYDKKEGFKNELFAVINRSETMTVFESSWGKMLKKYELEDNDHLKTMFKNRAQWVPAFFRGTFFANMSTNQRSEGMNAVLKLLVDNHTSIYRFALQLEKLVEGIWKEESSEDYKTINETPQLWSRHNLEVEARRVYTRRIFSLFKKILQESSNGFVVEVERERIYEVHITCHPFVSNWVPTIHQICINKIDETVSCSCKGFEFNELLCAHAIKVMQHVGMQNLPSKYIIKRWTRGANENVKRSIKERSMDMKESIELETMRSLTLNSKWMLLNKLASKSGPRFRFVDANLDELIAKVSTITISTSSVSGPENTSERVFVPSQSVVDGTSSQDKTSPTAEYQDPPLSQCKGRKRPQRLKPLFEKLSPKRRTCSYCNEQAGHNFRTCPKRIGEHNSEKNSSN